MKISNGVNKIALIIGGTGGIGSAIAKLLSKNNIKVYATYYHYNERVEKIKQSENFKLIQCDIRKDGSIEKAINQIIDNDSKIDILINTATSRLKLKPFEKLTYDEFFEDIQIMLLGTINLFKRIIPLMKKNKSGIIISFLTAAINNPPIRMSSYITAKYGLLGLIKSLGAEIKPFNINIYGISPSFVETDLIKAFPKKLLEIEREKQPDKKFIEPEDLAKLILDIVKKPDKYISGRNIFLETRQDVEYLIKQF